jgi:hypothetical protein
VTGGNGAEIWCTEYTPFGKNASLVTGNLWRGSWNGNDDTTHTWDLPRHQDLAANRFLTLVEAGAAARPPQPPRQTIGGPRGSV